MGMCHVIESGLAGYINAAAGWDKSWLSPIDGTTTVFEYSRQSWASQMVSFIVVKCDSVSVLSGHEDSRMAVADVEIRVNCKVEPVEFVSEIIQDGSGTCDTLDYIVPFIRDAEHARKIAKYNSEQMGKLFGGDMDALATAIEAEMPTYTGTVAAICQGTCPAFTINEITTDGGEVSTTGAMTVDVLNLTLSGYFEEYAI